MNIENEVKQWWDEHYASVTESKKYRDFFNYNGHYMMNDTIIKMCEYFYELGKSTNHE